MLVSDDDAGACDRDGQALAFGVHESFGLELGLFVGVPKPLVRVMLVLLDVAGVIASDIRCRDVGQAPQPAAGLTALGEFDHPPGALHVDLLAGLQFSMKRDGGGAVNDLRDLFGDLVAAPGV